MDSLTTAAQFLICGLMLADVNCIIDVGRLSRENVIRASNPISKHENSRNRRFQSNDRDIDRDIDIDRDFLCNHYKNVKCSPCVPSRDVPGLSTLRAFIPRIIIIESSFSLRPNRRIVNCFEKKQ